MAVAAAGGLGSLVLHAGSAAAQGRGDWWMGDHPMMWMWGAWGIGMMVVMLLFWAAVITGIALGIRWLLGQGRPGRADSALDILRERYARGEINREEFEQRKRDLLAS
jgi:putative membrane protein